MERAIEQASDDDVVANSSSSDSDSSSESSFAAAKQNIEGNEEEPQAKKKAKAKAKSSAAAGGIPPPKRPRRSTGGGGNVIGGDDKKGADSKDASRVATTLAGHEKTLALLSEVTVNAVWRSVVRASELDRRLGKATTCREELRKLLDNPKLDDADKDKAQDLDKKIESNMETIMATKEVSRLIRSSSPTDLAMDIVSGQNFANFFAKCSSPILADFATLADMLHNLSKKLVEVQPA